MKKITFSLFLLLLCVWQSNAQIFIEENLDSGFPAGWTQNSYFANTSATYLCEGTGNLADNMYGSSSNDGSLTSPNYAGISNGTDTTVEFQWLGRPFGTAAVDYIMYVEYSADDAANWSLLSSFAVTETTPCTDYLETIPAASLPVGSDFKFRIRGEWQSGDSYFYLDNLAISQVISCPQPATLLASNLSSTTADLEWTENGSASSWNVIFGEVGFDPNSEGTEIAVASNPYTLTGLTASTSYDYYVQADCGSGDLSALVGPYNFVTLCNVINTFPMLESFEGITSGQPICWEVQGTTTNASYEWTSFDPGYTGRGMRFDSYLNPSGRTSELISPSYDLTVIPTAQLSFWFKNPTGGNFDVLISTDDGATYTALETGLNGQVDWLKKTYDITANIASNVKLKFFGTSNYGSGDARIYLDEVEIKEIPSCVEPANVSGANIALSTADLSWSAGGSETEWEYALQLATDPAPTAGTSTTTTAYAATGLTDSTDYIFYVRAVCGSEFSVFESFSFTTLSLGSACEAAIEVMALPYNTTDDTANYGNNYSGSPGTSCGTSTSYLDGDDVVYSYTATIDGIINIALSSLGSSWSGIFVYTDCADIGTACVAGATNSSSSDYGFELTVTAGTTYYVVISTWSPPQSTTYTLDITQILCPDPTALTASNITTTTADLGWTAGATETTWNIEVVDITAGDSQTMTATDAGVTANPFTVTGLASSNDYEFYLQADCGGTDGVSEWVGPFAFSTSCEVITVFPSTTDFTNNPPTVCWSEAGSGEVVDGPSGTSGDWRGNRAYEDGDGNTVNSNAINLYSNTDREWLISPVYDLSASTDQMLKVNVAVTNYSSSSTPTTAGDTMGSDDEVQLLMTIDNGATWTNLTTWNVANQPSVNGTEFLTDLAAVTGNVQFALWASDGTVDNSEDYDFHVGEFEITDSTLSTSSFNKENNFTYYPNPVENTLSLKGIKNIQNVAVYNMLGQEVLRIAPNAVASELDMSNLQSGAYFVKVTIENATKTIKVIKQ